MQTEEAFDREQEARPRILEACAVTEDDDGNELLADSNEEAGTLPMENFVGSHKAVMQRLPVETGVAFNYKEFFKQFFYHMLLPLSIPIHRLVEGKIMCTNQGFIIRNTPGEPTLFFGVMQLVMSTFFWTLLILQLYAPIPALDILFIAAVFCLTVHRIMVATKYALLSARQLHMLRTRYISLAEHRTLELLQGWGNITKAVAESELRAAGKRLGVDLDNTFLYVTETRQSRVASESAADSKSQGTCLGNSNAMMRRTSLLQLAQEIVDATIIKDTRSASRMRLSFLLACGQVMIPVFARVAEGFPVNLEYTGAAGWTATILNIIVAFFFSFVLFSFSLLASDDFRRRFVLLRVCGMIVDPAAVCSQLRVVCHTSWRPPFVDLTLSQNIPTWFALRQVLMNFGEMYRTRLKLYSSYTLVFVVGLLIKLIYDMFFRPEALYGKSIMVLTIYNFVIVLLMLAHTIYHGTRSNMEYDRHCAVLLRVQFSLRELYAERITALSESTSSTPSSPSAASSSMGLPPTLGRMPSSSSRAVQPGEAMALGMSSSAAVPPPPSKRVLERVNSQNLFVVNTSMRLQSDHLRVCDRLIDSVLSCLAQDDKLNPVTIMGVRASYGLVQSMVTLAVSGALTVFRFLRT